MTKTARTAKTISVVSYKGGVGKTTTAIHLAAYIRALKKNVLVIDGDLNQSALDWYDAGKQQLPFVVISLDQWQNLLLPETRSQMEESCEYFVVDTPARPSTEEMQDLVKQSHCIIIPLTPDALSIRAALKMRRDLQKLAQSQILLNCKMLLNRVPPPPSTAGEEARQSLEGSGISLLPGGIKRLAVLEKAALQGITVSQIKGDRYAAMAWDCYKTALKALNL